MAWFYTLNFYKTATPAARSALMVEHLDEAQALALELYLEGVSDPERHSVHWSEIKGTPLEMHLGCIYRNKEPVALLSMERIEVHFKTGTETKVHVLIMGSDDGSETIYGVFSSEDAAESVRRQRMSPSAFTVEEWTVDRIG